MLLLSMHINQMLVCSLLLMCGVAHHYHNLYLENKKIPFKKIRVKLISVKTQKVE